MRAEKWEPVTGIEGPCDRISFSYSSGAGTAMVSMNFSAGDGASRNLILQFKGLVVLAGEDEAPGGFVPAPATESLPKLHCGRHPNWTFPLLNLLDSGPLPREARALLFSVFGQSGSRNCER